MLDAADASAKLADWLHAHPRVFVLTGAGCSTASGIPDYRDRDGAWKRTPPVTYQAFVREPATRARYWARSHAGCAVAIVSPQQDGDVVSVRVPRDAATSADVFCRRFPTGGGRRTAGGINHLPRTELERFITAFEATYRTS